MICEHVVKIGDLDKNLIRQPFSISTRVGTVFQIRKQEFDKAIVFHFNKSRYCTKNKNKQEFDKATGFHFNQRGHCISNKKTRFDKATRFHFNQRALYFRNENKNLIRQLDFISTRGHCTYFE
jgi:hypothetical protein